MARPRGTVSPVGGQNREGKRAEAGWLAGKLALNAYPIGNVAAERWDDNDRRGPRAFVGQVQTAAANIDQTAWRREAPPVTGIGH